MARRRTRRSRSTSTRQRTTYRQPESTPPAATIPSGGATLPTPDITQPPVPTVPTGSTPLDELEQRRAAIVQRYQANIPAMTHVRRNLAGWLGLRQPLENMYTDLDLPGLQQVLGGAIRSFSQDVLGGQAGRPPRGVTRTRYLEATQEGGLGPTRLGLGAPTGLFEKTELPTPERQRFQRGPALGYYVWYAKRLMREQEEESLYDPGAYYPGGAGGGGGGGGGVVVVRGGGTPGSQGRNYSSGLINWRI